MSLARATAATTRRRRLRPHVSNPAQAPQQPAPQRLRKAKRNITTEITLPE